MGNQPSTRRTQEEEHDDQPFNSSSVSGVHRSALRSRNRRRQLFAFSPLLPSRLLSEPIVTPTFESPQGSEGSLPSAEDLRELSGDSRRTLERTRAARRVLRRLERVGRQRFEESTSDSQPEEGNSAVNDRRTDENNVNSWESHPMDVDEERHRALAEPPSHAGPSQEPSAPSSSSSASGASSENRARTSESDSNQHPVRPASPINDTSASRRFAHSLLEALLHPPDRNDDTDNFHNASPAPLPTPTNRPSPVPSFGSTAGGLSGMPDLMRFLRGRTPPAQTGQDGNSAETNRTGPPAGALPRPPSPFGLRSLFGRGPRPAAASGQTATTGVQIVGRSPVPVLILIGRNGNGRLGSSDSLPTSVPTSVPQATATTNQATANRGHHFGEFTPPETDSEHVAAFIESLRNPQPSTEAPDTARTAANPDPSDVPPEAAPSSSRFTAGSQEGNGHEQQPSDGNAEPSQSASDAERRSIGFMIYFLPSAPSADGVTANNRNATNTTAAADVPSSEATPQPPTDSSMPAQPAVSPAPTRPSFAQLFGRPPPSATSNVAATANVGTATTGSQPESGNTGDTFTVPLSTLFGGMGAGTRDVQEVPLASLFGAATAADPSSRVEATTNLPTTEAANDSHANTGDQAQSTPTNTASLSGMNTLPRSIVEEFAINIILQIVTSMLRDGMMHGAGGLLGGTLNLEVSGPEAEPTAGTGGTQTQAGPQGVHAGGLPFPIAIPLGLGLGGLGLGLGGGGGGGGYEDFLRLAEILGPARPRNAQREDVERELPVIRYTTLPHKGKEVEEETEKMEVDGKVAWGLADLLAATREKCMVCLMNYEEGDELRIMRCRHGFHKNCLDEWLVKYHNSCPLCRDKAVERTEGSNNVSNNTSTSTTATQAGVPPRPFAPSPLAPGITDPPGNEDSRHDTATSGDTTASNDSPPAPAGGFFRRLVEMFGGSGGSNAASGNPPTGPSRGVPTRTISGGIGNAGTSGEHAPSAQGGRPGGERGMPMAVIVLLGMGS
ncbi:hypothetical protein HDU85_003906 [Gaertneriomyces sp. JEL0708]|nr:hypothetical protein HDU85_003906 [Gaertneriomyces sp. JEL0708]